VAPILQMHVDMHKRPFMMHAAFKPISICLLGVIEAIVPREGMAS
jgi:hypothetical protein